MSRIITNPRITIDGEVIPAVADSIEVNMGFDKITLEAQSIGNDKTTVTASNDIKESFGKIKFSVFSAAMSIKKFTAMQRDKNGKLTVAFYGVATSDDDVVNGVINNAYILDDITYNYKSQGQFDINIGGDKVKEL